MIKNCFFLMVSMLVMQAAKADTVSYWSIYYNKVKIADRAEFYRTSKEITLTMDEFKERDSITLVYSPCSPCWDCTTSMVVRQENQEYILTVSGTGSRQSLSFPASELFRRRKDGYTGNFEIYYSNNYPEDSNRLYLLFRIKIE